MLFLKYLLPVNRQNSVDIPDVLPGSCMPKIKRIQMPQPGPVMSMRTNGAWQGAEQSTVAAFE